MPVNNITVLGDPQHDPFRGIRANTALRDTQVLARNLITAAHVVSTRVRDP